MIQHIITCCYNNNIEQHTHARLIKCMHHAILSDIERLANIQTHLVLFYVIIISVCQIICPRKYVDELPILLNYFIFTFHFLYQETKNT